MHVLSPYIPSASVPACTKPTSAPALNSNAAVEPAKVIFNLAKIGLTCSMHINLSLHCLRDSNTIHPQLVTQHAVCETCQTVALSQHKTACQLQVLPRWDQQAAANRTAQAVLVSRPGGYSKQLTS